MRAKSLRWMAFCLLLLPALAVGQELRVMTFNIRYNTPEDGDNAWPHRREMVFRTIEAFDPDLLGLQEVQPGQGTEITERLTAYEMVGVPRSDGPRAELSPAMFKRDRFEKVRDGTFWLSETPEVAGSKGWDADLPRICTWVELRDKRAGGRPIVFFNTHWDHRGATARLESARLMRSRIADIAGDKPVIVTGDFNAKHETEPYHELLGDKLVEAFGEAHPRPTNQDFTFHGFTGKSDRGSSRIDWVLRSRFFRTKQAQIDRTNENGRYPSDHFPVSAVLQWADERR